MQRLFVLGFEIVWLICLQIQSALFTEDLRQVVKHVGSLFPSLRLYATGWSVGANILVRYLGQVLSCLLPLNVL